MKKQRLDQLVFELGFTESRERAKTTIMSGIVYVNGQKVDKPGTPVSPDANIEVRGNALPYVSRGGFKLEKALKVFPIDPTDKICIDCGASTGGFTDVLFVILPRSKFLSLWTWQLWTFLLFPLSLLFPL